MKKIYYSIFILVFSLNYSCKKNSTEPSIPYTQREGRIGIRTTDSVLEFYDKENAEKLQQKKYDYQNYLNLSHIKKSQSHKYIKDEYYNQDLLDKEFEDFLQHSQLYTSKDDIENHIKDKTTDKRIDPFLVRKEMKYLDKILTKRDQIKERK